MKTNKKYSLSVYLEQVMELNKKYLIGRQSVNSHNLKKRQFILLFSAKYLLLLHKISANSSAG
ncbi:hypothetical protein [Sphingobacterium kyonggiense]|uniref:hypothetical protein n=1 Tax=Sphingobacterium kyonggiense TaxID=714075 RepID=UPI0031DF45FE